MSKKHNTRTFRPWEENEKRLDLAERLGLNVSEVINESLKDRIDAVLKVKAAKIQQALQSVPA